MEMNIAICDDDEVFVNIIENYLEEYLQKQEMEYVIDKYSSGEVLLERNMEYLPYQIIFLDIKMRDINGLEVAKKLNQRMEQATIVFITAYIDFALAGYKVGAVRYILKNDINFQLELIECISAVIQKNRQCSRVERFHFLDGERTIHVSQILYIESILHKMIFHVKRKQGIEIYNLYAKLDDVEERLEDADFFRVHKSFLVNFRFVEQVTRYKVVFYNHQTVGIAKNRYEETKRKFLLYKGKQ